MEACASSVRRSGGLSRRCDGVVLSYGGKDSDYVSAAAAASKHETHKAISTRKIGGKLWQTVYRTDLVECKSLSARERLSLNI